MTTPLVTLFASQLASTKRERLCATLRQAIAHGALKQGERLPSSRLLATDLALSRVTVEAAYQQLESEGYLTRQTGKGTFVAIKIAPPLARLTHTRQPIKLSRRGQQVVSTGGCQDPPFPYAFAAGSPELRAFPHQLWQRISATQQRRHGASVMRYGDPQGYLPLRNAIAHYLAQSRGVICQAEQVMVLTSSQQALHMLALALLDPGDQVWLENPCYPGARHAFISAGANLTPLVMDADGARVQQGQPKLIYLTPSHHYPSGVSMGLSRRLAWLNLAQAQHSWLVEDDYDSEFWYHDRPMPALQGLDRAGRVIYLGTFSKSLFPSLRLAYLVVPPALVEPLCKLRSVIDGHSALLPQAITADFIEQGHFSAHLRLMRQLYHSRRDLLLEQLHSRLAERLTPISSSGGLQLTVKLNDGDDGVLAQQARQQGLLLPRLAPLYAPSSTAQQGWILGFSALERAEIIEGVNTLSRVLYSDGQSLA
ncbi:PLP-dependent aminotransferase family protein [Paramixta manurensis]|uniref:MocR-like pyridoxine biosynthesis transcription factor PdxR n=1 Tax=Paramixta manurensis TaxID=2740817 RepID=UPI003395E1AF